LRKKRLGFVNSDNNINQVASLGVANLPFVVCVVVIDRKSQLVLCLSPHQASQVIIIYSIVSMGCKYSEAWGQFSLPLPYLLKFGLVLRMLKNAKIKDII
jgi:hypothetical protein